MIKTYSSIGRAQRFTRRSALPVTLGFPARQIGAWAECSKIRQADSPDIIRVSFAAGSGYQHRHFCAFALADGTFGVRYWDTLRDQRGGHHMDRGTRGTFGDAASTIHSSRADAILEVLAWQEQYRAFAGWTESN